MPKTTPFEKYFDRYEEWFLHYSPVYKSELEAVRRHLPEDGRGIEIGVGSGLFAQPLNIRNGLEPSKQMGKLALKRGVNIIKGVAEDLPIENDFYDYALMVTTICFLDDVPQSIREAKRILKPGGRLIIGLVDRDSPIGKLYQKYQSENVFYRDAVFYTTQEVVEFMKQAGFKDFSFTQTVFNMLDEIREPEQVKEGYGEGSFVVISAENGK